MAKKLILTAAAVLILFSSCSNTSVPVSVFSGNIAYNNGRYQDSVLAYLKVLDSGNTYGRDVVLYNLANVYFMLSEPDAALEVWSEAEKATESVDILFRINFNKGVLYFQSGKFEEAYVSFKKALILKPEDLESKINLEESLSRIQSIKTPEVKNTQKTETDTFNTGRQLLDYVKRREEELWSGSEESADSSSLDW